MRTRTTLQTPDNKNKNIRQQKLNYTHASTSQNTKTNNLQLRGAKALRKQYPMQKSLILHQHIRTLAITLGLTEALELLLLLLLIHRHINVASVAVAAKVLYMGSCRRSAAV